MSAVAADVQQLDRAAIERWLPELDAWLLDGMLATIFDEKAKFGVLGERECF